MANILCCKYHPKAELVEDSRAGDMICPECGLVVGDRIIDVTSEWRSFSNCDDGKKDRSRVGAAENPALDNATLSTIIGGATGVASFDDGQLKYRGRREAPTATRNFQDAIREFETLAHNINAPQSIVEEAADVYRRIQDSGKFNRHEHEPLYAACIYVANRKQNSARTLSEVAAASGIKKEKIGQVFMKITRVLGDVMPVASSAELINRFCGRLGLDQKCVRVAQSICDNCTEYNLLAGRAPTTVAATAIYVAAKVLGLTMSIDVGEVAGCAKSTITGASEELLPHIRELLPYDAYGENVG